MRRRRARRPAPRTTQRPCERWSLTQRCCEQARAPKRKATSTAAVRFRTAVPAAAGLRLTRRLPAGRRGAGWHARWQRVLLGRSCGRAAVAHAQLSHEVRRSRAPMPRGLRLTPCSRALRPRSAVISIACAPSARLLYSAAADGIAEVDAASGEVQQRWTAGSHPLTCIALSPGALNLSVALPRRATALDDRQSLCYTAYRPHTCGSRED